MFRRNVYTFKNLPVEERQRKWTDCICTICSAIFALSLFILSFIMFHRKNFWMTNFPVDDTGETCVYEQDKAPFIYFQNPNDLTQSKYCVSHCPGYMEPIQCQGSNQAKCISLGGSKYQTERLINRLGAFCIATDPTVADHMWNSPELSVKNSLLQAYDVFWLALIIALCIGILFLVFTMFAPQAIVYLVFVGAFVTLVFAGIYLLAKPVQIFHPNGWNIALGVILIIAGLAFLVHLGCYRRELQLAGIFMKHSNYFLKETPIVFMYIPLFILLTMGLIVLITWQYIAFGTQFESELREGDLYRSSRHNIPLQVFNIIEFIWGLQFLRDAFNFVVSGNAIEWYFRNQNNNFKSHCCHPCTRLLCNNWGSVAGGSFLNAFFILFDSISDCFRCDTEGSCAKCNGIYRVCCCCSYLFDLIRSDAYAYINLTGIPYCNAARQCQALCQYSASFRGSQSCMRLYRIASHIFLVGLVSIICYFILQSRTSYINWYIIAIIALGSHCILTYFIDIHPDGAEGLMVSYLSEQNCEQPYMNVCPGALQQDMYLYNSHNR